MPLRCIRVQDNTSVQASLLSAEEWDALSQDNRKSNTLRMPCCNASVTLKRSKLGTQFFAHKKRGECTTAPEGQEHLELKAIVCGIAAACGWSVATEVSGKTPNGEGWIADVLAERGKARVAIEIQWSGQTNDETLRRQRRYADSGVRGLWLLRQPGFPVTQDLPAVCLGGSLEEGFTALIPSSDQMNLKQRNDPSEWHQAVPLPDFLRAAFAGQFKFGLPIGMSASVTAFATEADCWKCGSETRVLTYFSLNYGSFTDRLSLADISENKRLSFDLLSHIPPDPLMGSIEYRYSKSVQKRYLSNGCVHCKALQGDHYMTSLWYQSDPIVDFEITLDREWEDLLTSLEHIPEHWSLYLT